MKISPITGRLIAFLLVAFALAITASLAAADPVTVKIQVDSQVIDGPISPDFIGFGYETSAVAQTNYFSANNTRLIRLYRNLSTHGLIRIGGNISDHTHYEPNGVATVQSQRSVTIINHASLTDLAGFARATGWKVMWGLNLGTGTPATVTREAMAVAAALGDRLQSFQIGNEVDLHSGNDRSYAGYHSNYLAFKAAIRAALPQAVFSGPDVAGNLGWLTDFANTEAGDIKLLTYHYYRTGAMRPDATIAHLLQSDAAWAGTLQKLEKISKEKHVPYRINEVNSFYGGGKAGVSDTFASALWSLDYMFELAAYDCNGINLETDINQLAWMSHYSPIVHDKNGICHARPEYYGMLAFALADKGNLLKLTLDKGDINLTAYATKDGAGRLWLTIVNKDLAQAADVEISLPENYSRATAFRLAAPSAESKDKVTLAGAEVTADGNWSPKSSEKMAVAGRNLRLNVPPASAVLVRFQR
jgi:hypothetical protein